MRVKVPFQNHKEAKAALGVKIVADNLETSIAGTQVFLINPEDNVDELKKTVMADISDVFTKNVNPYGEGVWV